MEKEEEDEEEEGEKWTTGADKDALVPLKLTTQCEANKHLSAAS